MINLFSNLKIFFAEYLGTNMRRTIIIFLPNDFDEIEANLIE